MSVYSSSEYVILASGGVALQIVIIEFGLAKSYLRLSRC